MKKLVLVLTVVFFGLVANAINELEGKEGHGGDVVVCDRNPVPGVNQVEVLDISEGRNALIAYNYDYLHFSVGDYFDKFFKAISDHYEIKYEILDELNYVIENSHLLYSFSKYIIPEIMDEYNSALVFDRAFKVLNTFCRKEQLAVYYDDKVLVNAIYWNQLDNLNRAAIYLHEAIYKVFRKYGQTDSELARKVVAYGLSSSNVRYKKRIHLIFDGVLGFYKPIPYNF